MRGTGVIGRVGYRNEPDRRPAGGLSGKAGMSAEPVSAEPVCLPSRYVRRAGMSTKPMSGLFHQAILPHVAFPPSQHDSKIMNRGCPPPHPRPRTVPNGPCVCARGGGGGDAIKPGGSTS